MRIDKIYLKNYRQFRELEIDLSEKKGYDLHIIVGTNGTGKTNILNSINWCLYNEEPHLSKDSARLPIPNIKTIEEIEEGETIPVEVEVRAEIDPDNNIRFIRKAVFRKADKKSVTQQSSEFKVVFTDERDNTIIAQDDEAIDWVERTVPSGIREFFFFDGERLDKYFREATGQKIRHAVFQISQINLLKNELERKIEIMRRDLTNMASRANPNIEEKLKELEKTKKIISNLDEQIEYCNDQISIATNKIQEYGELLKGIPDIEQMEVDRQNYKNNIDNKSKTRIEKESDKEILLTGYGETVMLWPAIEKSLHIIDEKKNNKQIPPTIDKDLLDSILKSDKCKICGQVLDKDAKSYVQKIIDDTNISSEVAAELLQMGFYLHELENGFKNNEQKIHRIGEDINQLEKEINENDFNLEEINRQLSGYDEQKIADLHNTRRQFEETRDHNQRRLGALIAEIEQRNKTKDQLQKELDGELRKADHIEDLKKEINFCAKSLKILQNTSRCIMEETRERIQDRTKELFSNLTWKKDTFRDIIIDEDYNIDLIHSAGYSFLGSISAGESELLALAFTLALHEISGFDAPILIDTPVARISDTHRNKFAKILSEVSQNKQVLLLFTPSEYSIEVSSILDSNYATKYSLTLSSGEMVANMEAL